MVKGPYPTTKGPFIFIKDFLQLRRIYYRQRISNFIVGKNDVKEVVE